MAGVTVEFGAKDTGLEKSLEKVRQQLDKLNAEVRSGELSFDELQQSMRKIAQAEKVQSQLEQIASATDKAGDKAQSAAADFDRLDREMDQVSNNSVKTGTSLGGIKGSIGKVTAAVAGAVAALKTMQFAFDFMKDAVLMAADLEETMNKVNVIFQEGAADIERWANAAGPSLAMSKKEAADAAATFATFGKSAGLSGDNLVGFSTRLTRLATDMASFNNSTPEEGIMAIGAALRGESEPIRRFGVLLDDATLKNRALQMGLIDTTTQALTPQQRVLAAYNEIMAQTTDQQGDFERTSGSLSNQLKILQATVDDLTTQVGENLTPATTTFVQYVNDKFIPALEGMGIAANTAGNAIAELAKELDVSTSDVQIGSSALLQLGSSVNPLAGLFNQASMAIEYFSQIGNDARNAAAEAADGVEDLGDGAVGTAADVDGATESIGALSSSLMTLGGDGSGLFEGVNAGASELSSLLGDSEISLADMTGQISAQSELTTEQLGLYGNMNSELGKNAEQLNLQLGILQEQIQAETQRNAAIAERQQKSLAEYEAQIAINQAIADGNTELAKSLQYDIELAQLTERIAQSTGLTAEEARKLAENYLASKTAADEATKATRNFGDRAYEAGDGVNRIRRSMETVSQATMDQPVSSFRQQAKKAREDLERLKKFIGVDLSGMSLDDILNKLGLDSSSTDSAREKLAKVQQAIKDIDEAPIAEVTPEVDEEDPKKKLEKIREYLDNIDAPDATPKIKQETVKTEAEAAKKTITESFRDLPATIKLNADESIKAIRKAIAEPIEVNLTPKVSGDGGGGGPSLSDVVNELKAIKDKLPMQALA